MILIVLVALSDIDTNNYVKVLEYKYSLNHRSEKQILQESNSLSQTKIANNQQDDQVKIVNKLTHKQTRLNNEEITQIVDGYKSGLNTNELARKFNCHKVTISNKLKAAGVKIRRLPPSNKQIVKMMELYQSDLSLEEVGKQVGTSASTVLRSLRGRGVKTRGPHER